MTKVKKLSQEEVLSCLREVSGWALNSRGEIERTVELKDFSKALLFVNAIGFLAERANHHPDIDIRWNKVKLVLSTHDAGGLSEKDFSLATEINAL
jgi:4a-hydroxytetrahydrobiopterin dehydratase